MAPTVILIRHAQAEHNVAYIARLLISQSQNHAIPDPPLTILGLNIQCLALREHLQNLHLANEIDLIVISPMRRTLQTASQSLGWLIERGVPVILRADFQENSTKPCDTGSPIDVMREEWPQFNWSTVDETFPAKEGLYDFSQEALVRRGVEARKWLRERKEKVVAVVTHAGFLRVGLCGRRFENADYRIFDFAEGKEGLVEWKETEERGGGMGMSQKGVFGFTEEELVRMASEKEQRDGAKVAGEVHA